MDARNTFASLIMTVIFVFAFGTMAIASDIAFYVGLFQPGSYDDETMAADVEQMINDTGHQFNDIQQFGDADLDAFGEWTDANSADGEVDIIWLPGQINSALYPTFNELEDGSRAEKWLDDGNIIINTADWFAWATHENGEKERNTHIAAGFILDQDHTIILGAADTPMDRTAAGREYMPSIDNGLLSNRPVYIEAFTPPWEVTEIFGVSAGEAVADVGDVQDMVLPAGVLADPVVACNTETGGCLAIISQSKIAEVPAGTYRGIITSEFINNWVFGGGLTSVDPADKLAATWGDIKTK
jgi:hypothetical protein